MSVQDFYESEGFTGQLDVSASTRKFQTSIVVNQDPQKSGILSFLSNLEEQSPQPTIQVAEPTLKPQNNQDYK
tara:strand:+ start:247 stop:465 length:219 start_codon:yes stop_codon:yes gene_type:complete